MPIGSNLQPLSLGLRGGVILKDTIYRPFNYAEQYGYLKILIRCVLGIDGCGERLVAL